MSRRGDDALARRLRDAPVPGEDGARARAREVMAAAAAARIPPPPRRSRARLVALAAALALAGLVGAGAAASGPREAVGDLVRGLIRRDAPPAPRPLVRLPGGGRLLVASRSGAWIVHPDGLRRRLGRADQATWSAPLGRFVAIARGVELVAVDQRGAVRWAIARDRPVRDPRWSPDGQRIAFRSGGALHVIAGDGTGDRLLTRRAGPAAPAWRPRGPRVLALALRGGRVVVADPDAPRARPRVVARPGAPPVSLGWSRGGAVITARPDAIEVRRSATGGRLLLDTPDGRFTAAAVDPAGRRVAALLRRPGGATEVLVTPLVGGRTRRLLTAPDQLRGLTWSPDGRRLLVGWPALDQWYVLPTGAATAPRVLGGLRAAFGGTPRPLGWVR